MLEMCNEYQLKVWIYTCCGSSIAQHRDQLPCLPHEFLRLHKNDFIAYPIRSLHPTAFGVQLDSSQVMFISIVVWPYGLEALFDRTSSTTAAKICRLKRYFTSIVIDETYQALRFSSFDL